jgi:predicted small secreted protein
MQKHAMLLIFIVIAAFTVSGCGNPAGHDVKALNVNDLRSDPAAFTGTLTVTGVMAAVSPQDPEIFGIMDKSELLCTMPGCKKFYLPVLYRGQKPSMGDEIIVNGSFIKSGPGWLFTAETLRVVRKHKL